MEISMKQLGTHPSADATGIGLETSHKLQIPFRC